jgi:carbonic anhydrase
MKLLKIKPITVAAVLSFFCALSLAADHEVLSLSPEASLVKLKAGNARFFSRISSAPKATQERRLETAQTQHPFAVVVGCADSRTAPEIIFDQNIGDLFVIRTAGNLVDDYALGSIEYAVDHLGVRLIVVLGHERCGAVKAAVDGGPASGHVEELVRAIRPAVKAARSDPGDLLTNAVKENALRVAAKIKKEAELGRTAALVKVVTAYYDLDSGKVLWTKE